MLQVYSLEMPHHNFHIKMSSHIFSKNMKKKKKYFKILFAAVVHYSALKVNKTEILKSILKM